MTVLLGSKAEVGMATKKTATKNAKGKTVARTAKGAKAKKAAPVAKPAEKGAELSVVFDQLEGMLAKHAPPFKVTNGMVRNKRDYHLTVPVPVVISPKAYGGKPYPVSMAGLIFQKGYVGFYYSPMNPEATKNLTPELAKLRKGGSCFHVKALTPEVREGIKSALEFGLKCYREKGWV